MRNPWRDVVVSLIREVRDVPIHSLRVSLGEMLLHIGKKVTGIRETKRIDHITLIKIFLQRCVMRELIQSECVIRQEIEIFEAEELRVLGISEIMLLEQFQAQIVLNLSVLDFG